jgi:hypothetical protein
VGRSGLGSLDVYVAQGAPFPVIVARIYDDAGDAGTSGFAEPFYRSTAIPSSGTGYLIGPSDTARFRYNIGLRTLTDPVTITATVRNTAGGLVHTVTRAYPKNFFLQSSVTGFLGFSLANNQSIQITYQNGGLILYGATVDNITNDPSAQFLTFGSTNPAPRMGPCGGPARPGRPCCSPRSWPRSESGWAPSSPSADARRQGAAAVGCPGGGSAACRSPISARMAATSASVSRRPFSTVASVGSP